jgi:DNA-directed RNA polymerase subunit alpha
MEYANEYQNSKGIGLKLNSLEATIDELTKELEAQINEYMNSTVKPLLKHYHIPIEDLNLPPRPYRCLKKAGINLLGQLLQNSPYDLLDLKNGFGKKCLQDVVQALSKYSLVLKKV